MDKDINNRTGWVRQLEIDAMCEFQPAYQLAVAAFVTEKGDEKDLQVLREYFKEAYTGEDLSVSFKDD